MSQGLVSKKNFLFEMPSTTGSGPVKRYLKRNGEERISWAQVPDINKATLLNRRIAGLEQRLGKRLIYRRSFIRQMIRS